MANPLLYNAIDQYLYIDTQIDARTDQATREENRRTAKRTTVQCCLCCLCLRNVAVAEAKSPLAADINRQISENPYCLKLWDEIPNIAGTCIQTNGGARCSIPTDTYVFWVCDITGSQSATQPTGCGPSCDDRNGHDGNYFRCGNDCSFTVPAGVSKVQFDAWGPGAPSWGAQCCGGSPWGGSGSFMSTTLDVTPGDIYCLKAGCAICCSIQQPSSGIGNQMAFEWGTPTCICGPGFCNIRVEGGNPNAVASLWLRNFGGAGFNVQGCYGNIGGGSGQCWCNAGYHCFDNSCATCGVMAGTKNLSEVHGCVNKGFMYKVPGLFGPYCLDTNNYGYYQAPPIPRFACHSQWCFNFTSNACGGCNCYGPTGSPIVKAPGQGGFPTHVMSGCCICGTRGNMGAVRVAYKCC